MKKIATLILVIILIFNIVSISASAEVQSFPTYKEAIYNGLYNMETEIDLSEYNVTEDDVFNYIYYLIYQQPEVCYFNYDEISYSHIGNQIITLYFQYVISESEMISQRKFIDDTLNPVLEKVDENWSDTEKALYVHDWLVSNFMYDYRLFETPGTENHDIYGFLKDGIGVCQSYAYTYMYMMRKLGIESYMAISPEKDTNGDGIADIAGHGWNVVKIDGNWYHVDATYDDPILGESFHYDYVGEVSHNKFLLSDEQIVANDTNYEHYGFYVPYIDEQIVCNEYTGDDLWRNAVSSVLAVGEYWYYLDPVGANGGLLRTKDFKTTERVAEVGKFSAENNMYYWDKDDGGGYLCYYTGLFEYNEHLFFSDSRNIYVYDTHHNEVKTLPIEREEGNYYFGLNMKGKTITYITSRTSIAENVVQGSYTLSGHFLVTDWETVKEATETEDGLKVKRCYYCGEIVESQTIPALNQIKRGDVDGNGTVNASDLAYLKLFLAGNEINLGDAADYNGDGEVNATDLAFLKLHLAGA